MRKKSLSMSNSKQFLDLIDNVRKLDQEIIARTESPG